MILTPPAVTIYSDGSCWHADRVGGWGAVIQYPCGSVVALSGYEYDTTTQRMEMLAAIYAIEYLPWQAVVSVYTDNQGLANGFYSIRRWENKDWMASSKWSDGAMVQNIDLWKRLYNMTRHHTISIFWIRGHSGIYGNHWADRLAGQARKRGRACKENFAPSSLDKPGLTS